MRWYHDRFLRLRWRIWHAIRPTTRRTLALFMLIVGLGRMGVISTTRPTVSMQQIGAALLALGIAMYLTSNGHRHRWYGILISVTTAGLLFWFGWSLGIGTVSGAMLITMSIIAIASLGRMRDDC